MKKFYLNTIFIFSIILALLLSIVGITFNLYFIKIIGEFILLFCQFLIIIMIKEL